QHDQIHPGLLQQRELTSLVFSSVLRGHRTMPERDPIKVRQRLAIRMIAYDQRNRARQLAQLMPVQQVSQTVQVLRHEGGRSTLTWSCHTMRN
ncbi:MAG: hypothetical protein JWP98_1387, partial [Edaphobacter sp.]|nr:hypothetical protein [Edaphobacter sp.]